MGSDERYERVRHLFDEAMDRPESERQAFLRDACSGDDDLRTEVEDLIAAADKAESFMSDSVHAMVGNRIGKYTIKGMIAEGGMGVVLRAEQEEPRRDVALKLVRTGKISKNAIRRFKLEAEVLGHLDHPGIAQIFDAATTDDGETEQPYFVMELIDGEPLTKYADRKNLNTRERIKLMVLICDAIHHAHQKGIIHRDIKPANVLVREDGQPKVLDFGVARITDSDVHATTMHTDIGQVIGTLPYMSPEQVLGQHETLDTRSDIYALGVLAYELLTGQFPYELKGRTLPEAARIIAEEEASTLTTGGDTFPVDLETIVAKCLEKETNRRYGSAGELAADLRHFLNDEPITARPASAMYQFQKFARRNRRVVAVGFAGLAVLVAGLVVSLTGWSAANRAREQSVIEASKAGALVDYMVEIMAAPHPWVGGKGGAPD